MKIVCDIHIPFLVEAVQKEWRGVQVCPMKPEDIHAATVQDADVLVVRTRTKVDGQLLSGSKVRLVCTATIGYDHIDTAYCENHAVCWTSCPGCNAQAVCDYIEEALDEIFPSSTSDSAYQPSYLPHSIGIIGVGHVGSLVAEMAQRKGLKVLLNDPPKGIGVSLEEIARTCDIITFHVPLDATTYHLCDASFLEQCRSGALIINAARGGVVDEQALLRSGHPYVLDTWENEPVIDTAVLASARLASMHIAGYSVQGKRNATQMCLNAIADTFALSHIDLSPVTPKGKGRGAVSTTDIQHSAFSPSLAAITAQLKAAPHSFESLRKSYPLRN